MIRMTGICGGIAGLTVLAMFAGCGPKSYVYVKALGVERPLACVAIAEKDGVEVLWAVGDNSAAYRPALYAPNPGPPADWCIGVYLSKTGPKAIYVDHIRGKNDYLVYELNDIKIVLSDQVVTGHGSGRILLTNRSGEVLPWPYQDGASPVFPRETELTFVLRLKQEKCGPSLQATLDELRPVAEKFLFKTVR